MKLRVIDAIFRSPSMAYTPSLWYQAEVWALAEHGLSLFAAAVLAIRPMLKYVSSSLSGLSSGLYLRRSADSALSHRLSVSKLSRASSSIARAPCKILLNFRPRLVGPRDEGGEGGWGAGGVGGTGGSGPAQAGRESESAWDRSSLGSLAGPRQGSTSMV